MYCRTNTYFEVKSYKQHQYSVRQNTEAKKISLVCLILVFGIFSVKGHVRQLNHEDVLRVMAQLIKAGKEVVKVSTCVYYKCTCVCVCVCVCLCTCVCVYVDALLLLAHPNS